MLDITMLRSFLQCFTSWQLSTMYHLMRELRWWALYYRCAERHRSGEDHPHRRHIKTGEPWQICQQLERQFAACLSTGMPECTLELRRSMLLFLRKLLLNPNACCCGPPIRWHRSHRFLLKMCLLSCSPIFSPHRWHDGQFMYQRRFIVLLICKIWTWAPCLRGTWWRISCGTKKGLASCQLKTWKLDLLIGHKYFSKQTLYSIIKDHVCFCQACWPRCHACSLLMYAGRWVN